LTAVTDSRPTNGAPQAGVPLRRVPLSDAKWLKGPWWYVSRRGEYWEIESWRPWAKNVQITMKSGKQIVVSKTTLVEVQRRRKG